MRRFESFRPSQHPKNIVLEVTTRPVLARISWPVLRFAGRSTGHTVIPTERNVLPFAKPTQWSTDKHMTTDGRSWRYKRAALYRPLPLGSFLALASPKGEEPVRLEKKILPPSRLEVRQPARLVEMLLPSLLEPTQRGGIVMPDVTITSTHNGLSMSGGGFDPQLLRNALLLVDRLVQADNNGIKFGDLREACGELEFAQTSLARFSGNIDSNVLRTTAAETFRRLDERESGRWSVVRNEHENVFPKERLKEATALKVRLENALIFPDRDVPLEDVLAFKQRRQSELVALRTYLDGLVLEAERNGFSGLSQTHAFEKLLAALNDYTNALREQNFLKRLTDVEIKFSWNQALAATPAALLWSQGLTLPALALLGTGLVSSISMESGLGPRSRGAQPSPVAYLFRAKDEI